MNRNTLIGFSLIALLLIVFSLVNQPSQEELERRKHEQDSIAALAENTKQLKKATTQQEETNQQAEVADTTSLFYQAANDSVAGPSELLTLKNDSLELVFNTKGGALASAKIIGHKDTLNRQGIMLFTKEGQQMNFILEGADKFYDTKHWTFKASNHTDSTLTMTAAASNGGSVIIDYWLGPDYMLHFSVQAKGLQEHLNPTKKFMTIEWQDSCRQQEKGFTFENQRSSLTYKECDGGTDHLSETSSDEETMENSIDWVAFKNQYFSSVLIAREHFAAGSYLSSKPQDKSSRILKHYEARLITPLDPTGEKASEFEMYLGPNDFRLIQSVEKQSLFNKDLDLEQLVYLGWPLFRYINRWFTLYVFDFLRSMAIPMGVILILITLLLKAITYPMVKKSYMSSAKMRVLRPKLEEATKHLDKPEDALQKQQVQMQLYSEYGVSPLSGCLPMLIQMPIWIAMFNFVPNAIQLRRQSFLWIDDLSTYDPIVSWQENLWLIGDHISLTCILFCAANLLYSWFTMQQQKDQMMGAQAEQMKMMRWMMMLMPLMFFFMFNDYSSGLNFYYFVSLFFSALIMWVLRKTTNDEKLLAILEAKREENKKNPKKMSGFAARLQAMQEQQQRMQRERDELRKKRLGK